MILVYGQATYGKVDQFADNFHVCTQFFHLYYIPLIPQRSFLVRGASADEGDFQGVEIPLSRKSVLIGWARAALILVLVLGIGLGLSGLLESWSGNRKTMALAPLVLPFLTAAGAGLVYWLTQRFSGASPRRARELAALLDLEPARGERKEQAIPRKVSMLLA